MNAIQALRVINKNVKICNQQERITVENFWNGRSEKENSQQ